MYRERSIEIALNRVAMAMALALSLPVGCSRAERKTSDDDSTSTSTTESGGGPTGGTTVSVSGLAVLPSLEEVVKSQSGASFALSVSGTPPKFATLDASNLETNLTGSVSTLVASITAARQSSNWNQVKALVTQFRDGESKCHVMQDAARQLGNLTQSTTDMCMMNHVDTAGAGILVHLSGDTVSDGGFFSPSATEKVRSIFLNRAADRKIMVQIGAKSSAFANYRVKMTICTAGKAQNATLVDINETNGTMTYEGARSEVAIVSGLSEQYLSHYKVVGYLASEGDGTYGFDPSKSRDITFEHKLVGNQSSSQFLAGLNIVGDVLNTKFNGSSTFLGSDNVSATTSHRGMSSVRFSGTKASDAVIYEGAGKSSGSFTHGTDQAFTHDDQIAFEYNDTKSPRYDTLTASTYLNTVASVDFATDRVLSQTSLSGSPDVSLVKDDDCALSASSVYVINGGAPAYKSAIDACQAKFDGADNICQALQAQENTVWSALRLAQ